MRKVTILILFALLLVSASKAGVEIPYKFEEGQPAKADEVNKNFTVLKDSINDLEKEVRTERLHVGGKVGIGTEPSNRGEQVRIKGWTIFGEAGSTPGAVTLMPPDGTGFYHIDNPGGQKVRISGGSTPGHFEYMTIGHPGKVIIKGDLQVTGTKSFVYDHPTDPIKNIVYVSLEGPEAGTYIRGTAQLIDGEAVISLPQYFSLVTTNDGLTVLLTSLDECNGLRVVRKSPKEVVVKELLEGKSNAKFDYLVQGVRKGHENHQVIQDKEK